MTQMLLLIDRYKLAQSHLRKQNHGTVPAQIDRVAYNRHLGGYLDLDVYEALEQLSKRVRRQHFGLKFQQRARKRYNLLLRV